MTTDSSWEFTHDPNEIIPLGFMTSGGGKVVGFSSPRGSGLKKMMVRIVYHTADEYSSATTIGYMTILREFILSMNNAEYTEKFC
jgi:hypothetical protein